MIDDLQRYQSADLLFRVLVHLDPGTRSSILAELEDASPTVVRDVRAMLRADQGTALEHDAWRELKGDSDTPDVIDDDDDQSVPEIPNYSIQRRIGSGAMGIVYLARQHRPVERDVALKLIRLGMNSTEIVRRFEYERQTLARFDHPGIARVYDAGIAPDGRPFFVMAHVDGARLDRYCDEHQLTIEARLALFVRLCETVHHAHQRGIIHRDLKPSNVLVTEREGVATPVVIDFGIAKAIHEDAVHQTFLTHRGQLVGTPAYMSPEQAAAGRDMVDIRSDVYALGVILYELMVGSTPLTDTELQSKPFDLLCRQIRETDPPRPSTRLSEIDGPTAASIASHRRTPIASMQRTMRRDLDWIIMRAIERDPERRYVSAVALADDVMRHLRDEPVHAGPPSTVYVMGKFVKRHRGAVAAGIMLVMVILAAAGVAGVFAVSENRARADMEKQALVTETVNQFLRDMLAAPNPRREGRDVKMIDLIDAATDEVAERFAGEPVIEADIRQTLGVTYRGIGELEKAETQLQAALTLHQTHLGPDARKTLVTQRELANLLLDQARLEEAATLAHATRIAWERLPDHETDRSYWNAVQTEAVIHLKQANFEEAERLASRALDYLDNNDGRPGDIALVLNTLGGVHYHLNDWPAAEETLRRSLAVQLEVLDENHADVLLIRRNLAGILAQQEKVDEAEAMLVEVVALHREVLGDKHRSTIAAMNSLSRVYHMQEKFDLAIEVQSEALMRSEEVLGETHLETIGAMRNLAQSLQRAGRKEEGDDMLLRVFETRREALGDMHPNTLISMYDAGTIYGERGQLDLAEQTLRQAVAGAEVRFTDHWIRGAFEVELGEVLTALERYQEAEAMLLHAVDILVASQGEHHANTQIAMTSLVNLYTAWGRAEDRALWEERMSIEPTGTPEP